MAVDIEHVSASSEDPSGDDFITNLKASIQENSKFFDHLVELIPAKFYLPSEDTPHPAYNGMSKKLKAKARKALKETLRTARRAKLDPDNCLSTLELVKRNAEKEDKEKCEEEDTTGVKSLKEDNAGSSATYEELKKKMQKIREEFQSKRSAIVRDNLHGSKKDQNKGSLKRKKEHEKSTHGKSVPGADNGPSSAKHAKVSSEKEEQFKKESSPNFEFGRVKIGIENKKTKDSHKKKKESKSRLLEKATKLQSTLQDPEKGQAVFTEHSWSVAAHRASGAKVFDDPKLLKKSIKKEKQQQQKHAKKWKERKRQQAKAAQARQQTRTEHIQQRIQQKKERLIAKREKKLLRPGFEGRKDGFINS